MSWIIFDAVNGVPLRTVTVPPSEVDAQCRAGEVITERTADMVDLSQWRWVDGEAVKVEGS